MQTKRVFNGMCLNHWGGVEHQVLEFNQYVNLFSGKSGSGKSTVMDAIQVLLYGSLSSAFLNKAADDAKNKRSVLSYLKGEQKDGTANRGNADFCSTIVLELEDTGSHSYACVGVAFEVKRNDPDVKKYVFFSHAGRMPESKYIDNNGYVYTNQEIKKLVENCKETFCGRDINHTYISKEAYLSTLYDVILGYIDGNRFQIMEKSAIALKMTNGTGQFIRDYMFPKSESSVIGKISDQLGAYRDIQDKIKDIHKRIELLRAVQAAGLRLSAVQTAIEKDRAYLRCLGVVSVQKDIMSEQQELAKNEEEKAQLEPKLEADRQRLEAIEKELEEVTIDLKASDLGIKEAELAQQQQTEGLLKENNEKWQRITQGLQKWETAETVTDYVSNPMLQQIDAFCKGKITAEQCCELRNSIKQVRENVEEALEEYRNQKREAEKEISELETLVEDISNDRKPYSAELKKARNELEQRLSQRYGRTIKVHIMADLFDVCDQEWKNAIEGRLGRRKLSLVTEPQYAHDAAVIFRDMKQYEEVDLIHTKEVAASNPHVEAGSLYEAVETKYPYVDNCLRYYLGRIIKCHSVEELEKVREGVTPDCYSHSGFTFRHLRRHDYDRGACIGSKVSKEKLSEYRNMLAGKKEESKKLQQFITALKIDDDFEKLNDADTYLVNLSTAKNELVKTMQRIAQLQAEIQSLKEGRFKELQERQQNLENLRKNKKADIEKNQEIQRDKDRAIVMLQTQIESNRRTLEEQRIGYIPNEALEQAVEEDLTKVSKSKLEENKKAEIETLEGDEQQRLEERRIARNHFNQEYPSVGFNGEEKTNEVYDEKLLEYETNYEPKFEEEFAKQCVQIYKSLRENVIATIHGDINAARRHMHDINRLLRQTNFADSTYQIKLDRARNENGQFYDMLTASELDSKNVGANVIEGQLSLNEDEFYQKYESKIKLLIEKFMPIKDEDGTQREKHVKEMEQYADYRNYLSFSMYEQVTDEQGNVIRENYVDEMAGKDSGGEGQNPKYVALLAGFAMLYMQQSSRDSKIKLVLLDEAFSKMDQERSAVCLQYARKMELQLIVCVPDERLQSLIRNVDCVYGFRRYHNQISMMHIDKGDYLQMMEGSDE